MRPTEEEQPSFATACWFVVIVFAIVLIPLVVGLHAR